MGYLGRSPSRLPTNGGIKDPSNDTHVALNSKDSLNFLYQTLVDNPGIVIELQAHTDSRGNDAKNQILSEERAKSCVDYLVNEKKIPLARLMSKGWGEKKLLIKDVDINKPLPDFTPLKNSCALIRNTLEEID